MAKIYKWDAPEGYWYTQKGETETRSFVVAIRAKNEKAIEAYELWSDKKKQQWESEHPQETETATA